MMAPLADLAERLNSGTVLAARQFTVGSGIDEVLADMRRRYKTAGAVTVPHDLQIAAVRRFWESQSIQSFRESYQISWALTVPHKTEGPCIFEDDTRMQTVLDSVNTWRERPAAFRRCYQGLMHSYFSYDGSTAGLAGRKNWTLLRDYLYNHCAAIAEAMPR